MRVLARTALVLPLLTLLPRPAAGQTVDEIVTRHLQARGGYDRLKAIETIKITRTVVTAFSEIKVIIYKKRPQLYRLEQGPPKGPLTPRGINADTVWDTGPGGTVLARPPAEAAEARAFDADFDGLLVDWKEKGHTVTYEGTEPAPGGNVLKLKVVTSSGPVRFVHLDAKTFLDRRHVGVLTLPGGRQFDVTIDFGNWRDVEGVKFPFDVSEERTGKEPVQSLVSYTDKIELNLPMDDALFAVPKS